MPELKNKYKEFYENNIDDRLTDGDASETGIVKFFEEQESIDTIRNNYPIHTIDSGNGVKNEIKILK